MHYFVGQQSAQEKNAGLGLGKYFPRLNTYRTGLLRRINEHLPSLRAALTRLHGFPKEVWAELRLPELLPKTDRVLNLEREIKNHVDDTEWERLLVPSDSPQENEERWRKLTKAFSDGVLNGQKAVWELEKELKKPFRAKYGSDYRKYEPDARLLMQKASSEIKIPFRRMYELFSFYRSEAKSLEVRTLEDFESEVQLEREAFPPTPPTPPTPDTSPSQTTPIGGNWILPVVLGIAGIAGIGVVVYLMS